MKLYTFKQWCRINESMLLEGKQCSQEEIASAKEVISKANNLLPKAIGFWKGWIGDPITKAKFKKAYGYDDIKADEIFKKYYEVFSKIQIMPYGRCSDGSQGGIKYSFPEEAASRKDGAYAFVISDSNTEHVNRVYFNTSTLSGKSDEFIEGVLVHEVQHILYSIHSLNPQIKLQDCFTVGGKVEPSSFKKWISGIFKKPKTSSNIRKGAVQDLMKTFKIDKASAESVIAFLDDLSFDQGTVNYATSDTELLSRVMTLRHKFKIKPGQDITAEHLKPTINSMIKDELNQNSIEGDEIIFILLHWSLKNYLPLMQLINNLNSLAANQLDNSVKTV